MNQLATVFVLGALGLAACTPDYTYVPTRTSSAVVSGLPAADYPMAATSAAKAPAGDVRVATLGVVNLHRPGVPDVKAIDVRLVLTNDGAAPWVLDTRRQRMVGAGGEDTFPMSTSTGLGTPPPLVQVGTGVTRTIDLFFPVGAPGRAANGLPKFDVLWTLEAGGYTVEHHTSFDRLTDQTQNDNWNVYGSMY
jgi:hypothetical protein